LSSLIALLPTETTAGTLASAFAFLALYPSYQTSIHKEAAIAFENGSPSYPSTYHSLPFTLAVIYESLRLAGPASTLLRRSTAATSVPSKVIDKNGSWVADSSIVVAKGSYMRENVLGVHYSDDWDSPTEFKPERFIKDENSSEQMKSCEFYCLINAVPRDLTDWTGENHSPSLQLWKSWMYR